MFSPSELFSTLAFVLCSFFLLSECSIINDPSSTVICLPSQTSFNVNLAHGINAGVFTSIPEARTMPQCIRQSCNRKRGNVAFLIENNCFMVSCFKKEYCKTVPNETPNLIRVSVTHYTYFDAAPLYRALPETIYVKENNKLNKFLVDIFARARSRRSKNARISFSITRGNKGNVFKIVPRRDNRSASLVAHKTLDREIISTYYITIRATNVDENKYSTKTLIVQILDENGNGPEFFKSTYSKSIFSNITTGTEVFRVNAVDADTSGDNARIRYYLLNYKHLFQMLPESGTIILKQKIRIDRSRTFTLIVAAVNGNNRTITTIKLNVLAVNEYRPYFQRLKYEVKVSAAIEVGTSVLKVAAMDGDIGLYGKLRFSIISGNRTLFGIDDDGVIRNLQSLLNLGGRNSSLVIGVEDTGIPPLQALLSASVTIMIENISNNIIKFDVPVYEIVIAENTRLGSAILTVRAVLNPDRRGNMHMPRSQRRNVRRSRRIQYSIENIDGAVSFRIGRHNGMITTRVHIDYEKIKEYRLTVVAKENTRGKRGARAQMDKTLVKIKVEDRNDNNPRFALSKYNKVISENTTVDSSILRVTANDADSQENARVQYMFKYGNINDTFSLDDTGTIKLRRSLDGQHSQFYNLTIVARDRGMPPLSSKPVYVYLKVLRHNTEPTKSPFTFPVPIYLATVNESCPPFTEVLRVRARNEHQGSIRYFLTQISDGDVDLHFGVNSKTGVIKLIKELDYEKKERYVFLIAAIDVRTASAVDNVLVRITVTDVNDNRPVFYQHKHDRMFKREPPLFYTVAHVKAFDKDSGKNAELTYWISGGNEKRFFQINSKTGVIKTVRMLQRQSLALFNLTVSVVDHGTPPLKSIRNAEVSVLLFQPFSTPVILIDTSPSTITIQFNFKYLDVTNVEKFDVIVQEYVDDDRFAEYTKREPLTWFLINYIGTDRACGQSMQRYISKIVKNTPTITSTAMLQVTVGSATECKDKKKAKITCNGPLTAGAKYRFQLRAYLKSSGPFRNYKSKDGDFSEAFFTDLLLENENNKGLPVQPRDGFPSKGPLLHLIDAEQIKVRLSGNNADHFLGRVEIYYNGTWGTVCDNGWDINDGHVICRMLGFERASLVVTTSSAIFGPGSGRIWLNNLQCTGNESLIEQCGHQDWGKTDCSHSEDAGVVCYTPPAEQIKVRLAGNNADHFLGRVEIYYNGTWGTVCDNGWDINDGHVICRMLGFERASVVTTSSAIFGPGSGRIWLKNLQCTGNESRLEQCGHQGWGKTDCSHSEDTGVVCYTPPAPQNKG